MSDRPPLFLDGFQGLALLLDGDLWLTDQYAAWRVQELDPVADRYLPGSECVTEDTWAQFDWVGRFWRFTGSRDVSNAKAPHQLSTAIGLEGKPVEPTEWRFREGGTLCALWLRESTPVLLNALLVDDIERRDYAFDQADDNKPVRVKHGGRVVGLLMPLHASTRIPPLPALEGVVAGERP